MCSLTAAVGLIGTAVSVMGQLQQGRMAQAAAEQEAQRLEVQKQQDAQLSSIEEWRTRQKMRRDMRRQQAEIGARGFDLASPTALFLGQEAAKEIAFEGAAIRQGAVNRGIEIDQQQEALRVRGQNAVITSRYSAAGTVLNAVPKLWPELGG
jgi:urease accessory protein UreF